MKAALLGSLLLAQTATAQTSSARYLVTGDGTVHLKAANVEAIVVPPGSKPAEPTDAKWKEALGGKSVESVVADLRAGKAVAGFKEATSSMRLGVAEKNGKVILAVARPKPSMVGAIFTKDSNGAWSSPDAARLADELKSALAIDNPVDAFAKALGSSAQGTAWTRLVEGARAQTRPTVLWDLGGKVVAVQPVDANQIFAAATFATAVAPSSTATKPAGKTAQKDTQADSGGRASLVLWLLGGVLLAGAPLGYMLFRSGRPGAPAAAKDGMANPSRDEEFRHLAAPVLEAVGQRAQSMVAKDSKFERAALEWSVEQMKNSLRAPGVGTGTDDWVQRAGGTVLREYGLNGHRPAEVKAYLRVGEAAVSACSADRGVPTDKLTTTDITNWLGNLARENTQARQQVLDAQRVAAEGERLKREADAFIREKMALVQELESNKSRVAQLEPALADADKKSGEAMQQLDRIRQRLNALNELMRHLRDGQRSIQHRINDPEVFSIVGYLVNYSMANLLSPEAENKPGLQKAMLENLWNIAKCFEDSSAGFKQAVKLLQQQAPWLEKGAAVEGSPEPHDERSHFQLLLENAKYRKQIQIPVFHIDVDAQGRPQSARPA